jgi:hypothetical protein
MNDTDLADLTDLGALVRDAVRETHMTVPESDINRRARRLRARRRLAVGGAASAGLAAAALAVTGFAFPATSPASQDPAAQVTAWTVAEQPSGAIDVTIRDLKDPDGLQARLRADGVPASVTFGRANPACRPYYLHAPKSIVEKGQPPVFDDGLFTTSSGPVPFAVVIQPDHLQPGEGIQLSLLSDSGGRMGTASLTVGAVQATPACTG